MYMCIYPMLLYIYGLNLIDKINSLNNKPKECIKLIAIVKVTWDRRKKHSIKQHSGS